MSIKEMCNDDNTINEKSVIGFLSFIVMFVFAVADIFTGYFGKELVINEFIYNSFLIICLGSFGIGTVSQIFKR